MLVARAASALKMQDQKVQEIVHPSATSDRDTRLVAFYSLDRAYSLENSVCQIEYDF